MNPEQIELIQSSWRTFQPDAASVADLFYDRLFELSPEVQELFAEDMTEQKQALLAMLNRVVSRLRDLDILLPVLRGLGARHAELGVGPDIYPLVGETLLWAFEQKFSEQWNSALKNAWRAAFVLVSGTMVDSANENLKAAANAERELTERVAANEAEETAKAEMEAAALAEIEEEPVDELPEQPVVELEAEQNVKKKKKRRGSGAFSASQTSEHGKAAKEQASGPQRQLVVFDLDTEQYGLDIGVVREIIRLQTITDIPRTPDFVEGVINLRGKVIPVVDLRKRFNMELVERDDDFRIVVVDVSGNEIGMIVDAVTEVSRVPENGIEPPSSVIVADDADYLTGIAKTDEKMIILLDIGKLISVRDMRKLSNAVPESTESQDVQPGQPEQDEQAAA